MLASKLRRQIPANAHSRHNSSTSRRHRSCTQHFPETASSWTSAIRSSAQLGRFRHALALYARMHGSGHLPDPFAISAALKACARIPSKPSAAAIHAHVHKYGHQSDVYAQTALLDTLSKLYGIEAAQRLFDEMPVRNIVSWNSILSSFLRAGDLEAAKKVFDEMPVRDVVSWNSMVSGYAKAGDMGRAAAIFRCMPEKNSASWNGMISGYINHGDIGCARELFDRIPVKSNVSWIAMISGYARIGDVGSASELFERMNERDLISWNAVIACCAQNGRPREALRMFNRMLKIDGIQPDELTFTSVVSSCSQLGDLRYGMWIEYYISSLGIELDDHLRTALIDLNSKCGAMDKAIELFDDLTKKDVVPYSAMILGCGINGRSGDAIDLFDEMIDAKVNPNAVTFAGLLTAYNHAGMVEEGSRCLASMWDEHRVSPTVDHYAIVVDLLGRNGRLEEARRLIEGMPMEPHVGVWGALLLACRLHGNVEIGEVAAQSCFELEPAASGYYVLLANVYAQAGRWEEAKRLRKVMIQKGLIKMPGCSWVQ